MSERVQLAFCWVVGGGWLANLMAGMIPPLHYEPSLIANAPMMLVLGAVYMDARRKKLKESDDDGS